MMANRETRRIPIAGPLFAIMISFTVVVAWIYAVDARRTTRLNAIKSYSKGEADCRRLESLYLDLATKERDEASKLPDGSIQKEKFIYDFNYYKELAQNAHRIAESNADMVHKLKQLTNTP
jgi:hypothetical protein